MEQQNIKLSYTAARDLRLLKVLDSAQETTYWKPNSAVYFFVMNYHIFIY